MPPMTTDPFSTKLRDRIPQNLLEEYRAHKITSTALAKLLDCHPVTLRKLIKRPPKPYQPSRKDLLVARRAFRAQHSHLPISTLKTLLNVSRSTAYRIKKRGKDAT